MLPDNHLHMSAEERVFVVAYIRSMRRDFWRVQTVMSLMDPTAGSGITDFMLAIELAGKINELHVEFEYNLLEVAGHLCKPADKTKHLDMPSVDQLADLFTLSFFKLVSVEPSGPAGLPKKTDNGWSSGAPGAIKTALNLLETDFFDKKPAVAPAGPAAIAAVIIDLFSKLFNWQQVDFAPGDETHFADWVPYLTNPHTQADDEDDDYYTDDDEEDAHYDDD